MSASSRQRIGSRARRVLLVHLVQQRQPVFERIDEADLVSAAASCAFQEPRVFDPLPLAADRSVEYRKMQAHGVPPCRSYRVAPTLSSHTLARRARAMAHRGFRLLTVAAGGSSAAKARRHWRAGMAKGLEAQPKKARAVGINHVALEVGDIEEALAFYGRCSTSDFAARANFGLHRSRRPVPRAAEGPYAARRRRPPSWTCGR